MFLGHVEQLLRDPTCCISWSRGVRYWNNFDTGYREAVPTEGQTFTIEVHGGAVESEESPEDQLRRLQGQHRGGQ
jgi:hypothetical protein